MRRAGAAQERQIGRKEGLESWHAGGYDGEVDFNNAEYGGTALFPCAVIGLIFRPVERDETDNAEDSDAGKCQLPCDPVIFQ